VRKQVLEDAVKNGKEKLIYKSKVSVQTKFK
jgi:hypothetical protein